MGTLQATEGAWAPREPPGKPEAWTFRLLLPPQVPAMGLGPAFPGPGSPQVNIFGRHPGQGAADSFTDKGFELWGDRGCGTATNLLVCVEALNVQYSYLVTKKCG